MVDNEQPNNDVTAFNAASAAGAPMLHPSPQAQAISAGIRNRIRRDDDTDTFHRRNCTL